MKSPMPKTKPLRPEDLFTFGEDWIFNACLNFGAYPMDGYSTGYKMAADALVLQAPRLGQDFLVFPILFLYRHYLELKLKDIIWLGRHCLQETAKFPGHHDLLSLWADAKTVVNKVFGPKDSFPKAAYVGRVIKQFARMDQQSDAFRYPIDKSMKPHLAGVTHINLKNVALIVGQAADSLDGVGFAISARLEDIQTAEAEMHD